MQPKVAGALTRLRDSTGILMKLRLFGAGIVCVVAIGMASVSAKENAEINLPAFEELYGLVRSNVATVSRAELNEAAVLGFLEQLSGAVVLVTNAPAEVDSNLVAKSTVFEQSIGYIRVGRVGEGLARQVQQAYENLQSTNKLDGLVMDLRFARGHEYSEAAAVADLFVVSDAPLLQLGSETLRAKNKSDSITLPVAVLVNEATAGAAEALAAAMRTATGAIVIGQTTAGQARVFKEFTLSNGQKVKLATESVRLADGTELARISPDLTVSIAPEQERSFLEDPFRTRPAVLSATQGAASPEGNPPGRSTNGIRRPRNESELIRMRREELGLDPEVGSNETEEPAQPVLTDPALARGVDFLKGLAVMQRRRGND